VALVTQLLSVLAILHVGWRIPSQQLGHAAMLKVLVVPLQNSRVPRLVAVWNEGQLRVGCLLKLKVSQVEVEAGVAAILVAVSRAAAGTHVAVAAAAAAADAAAGSSPVVAKTQPGLEKSLGES
jgi:hypothetical protein